MLEKLVRQFSLPLELHFCSKSFDLRYTYSIDYPDGNGQRFSVYIRTWLGEQHLVTFILKSGDWTVYSQSSQLALPCCEIVDIINYQFGYAIKQFNDLEILSSHFQTDNWKPFHNAKSISFYYKPKDGFKDSDSLRCFLQHVGDTKFTLKQLVRVYQDPDTKIIIRPKEVAFNKYHICGWNHGLSMDFDLHDPGFFESVMAHVEGFSKCLNY